MISFVKYQGTGNDFILLDNRDGIYNSLSVEQISKLCNRRFGIGADGLIKINSHTTLDFEVDYYNSDGSKSFCGNGARCAVAFAHSIGVLKDVYHFDAIDGVHSAEIKEGLVHLKMNDVKTVDIMREDYILDTGSPHYIHFVDSVKDFDIVSYGKSIRYSEKFKINGINVNAVEVISEFEIAMKTYERGVEDETLSCGTGVTAAAITHIEKQLLLGLHQVSVHTQGGKLMVEFEKSATAFTNIWLVGPAERVFEGRFSF